MAKETYGLTIFQWLLTPFLWFIWVGRPKDQRKESWHLVLKGMEKHECKFNPIPFDSTDYTYSITFWHKCEHEGCNVVMPTERRTKKGIEADLLSARVAEIIKERTQRKNMNP